MNAFPFAIWPLEKARPTHGRGPQRGPQRGQQPPQRGQQSPQRGQQQQRPVPAPQPAAPQPTPQPASAQPWQPITLDAAQTANQHEYQVKDSNGHTYSLLAHEIPIADLKMSKRIIRILLKTDNDGKRIKLSGKLTKTRQNILRLLSKRGIFFHEGKFYANPSQAPNGQKLFDPINPEEGLMHGILHDRRHLFDQISGYPPLNGFIPVTPTDAAGLPWMTFDQYITRPPLPTTREFGGISPHALMDPRHPDHADAIRRYTAWVAPIINTPNSERRRVTSIPPVVFSRSLRDFMSSHGYSDEEINQAMMDNHAQHHSDAQDRVDYLIAKKLAELDPQRTAQGFDVKYTMTRRKWEKAARSVGTPSDHYQSVYRRPMYLFSPAVVKEMQEKIDKDVQPYDPDNPRKTTMELGGQLFGTISIDPESGTPFVHVSHIVWPDSSKNTTGSSQLANRASSQEAERLIKDHPGLTFVGHFHSHPARSNSLASNADNKVLQKLSDSQPWHLAMIHQAGAILRPDRSDQVDPQTGRMSGSVEPDWVTGNRADVALGQGGAQEITNTPDPVTGRPRPGPLRPLPITTGGGQLGGRDEPMYGADSHWTAVNGLREYTIPTIYRNGVAVHQPLSSEGASSPASSDTLRVGLTVPFRGGSYYVFPSQMQVLRERGMFPTVPFTGMATRRRVQSSRHGNSILAPQFPETALQNIKEIVDKNGNIQRIVDTPPEFAEHHVVYPSFRSAVQAQTTTPITDDYWNKQTIDTTLHGLGRRVEQLMERLRQHIQETFPLYDNPEANTGGRAIRPRPDTYGPWPAVEPAPRPASLPPPEPERIAEMQQKAKERLERAQSIVAGTTTPSTPQSQQIAERIREIRKPSDPNAPRRQEVNMATKSFFSFARWRI